MKTAAVLLTLFAGLGLAAGDCPPPVVRRPGKGVVPREGAVLPPGQLARGLTRTAQGCLRRAGCTYTDDQGCVICKPECRVGGGE